MTPHILKIKVDLEISQIANQCDITTFKNWIGDIALMKRGKKSYTCFNEVLESDIIFSIR